MDDVKMGGDERNCQRPQQMLQGLGKGLDRSMAVLALRAADQVMQCPDLVSRTPTIDKKGLSNFRKWFTSHVEQRYSVVATPVNQAMSPWRSMRQLPPCEIVRLSVEDGTMPVDTAGQTQTLARDRSASSQKGQRK